MARTSVIKIDCAANAEFCGTQSIGAFPTLRVFHRGEKLGGDFKGDRTVAALTTLVTDSYRTTGVKIEGLPDSEASEDGMEQNKGRKAAAAKTKADQLRAMWVAEDHPGCRINGNIWVNRVPGRVQIEAKPGFQNINPKAANASHVVHHIGFGTSLNRRMKDKLSRIPEGYATVTPMNGNVYKTTASHTSHHHHLYIVPSQHLNPGDANIGQKLLGSFMAATFANILKNWRPWSEPTFQYNQLSYQSQMIHFNDDEVPAVTFAYDISPLIVTVAKERMPAYEFVVKLLALIGGTFTIFSITERGVQRVRKKNR